MIYEKILKTGWLDKWWKLYKMLLDLILLLNEKYLYTDNLTTNLQTKKVSDTAMSKLQ